MLVDRSVLIKYLEDKFIRVLLNDKPLEEAMYDYAEETYNFTKLQFSEYTSMRKALPEASDLELFVMTDSYLKQLELKNGNLRGVGKLSNYFTPKEIHDYSGLRFDADPLEKEIEWPLKFDMIQITDDQWIGKIDINELFYFMNKGLINYNPETQRAMTKVTKNGNNFYKITIDQGAVNAIRDDIIEEIYIPSDITLNIPKGILEENTSDFYYDCNAKQLIINHIDTFDINDGYHRYLALLKAKREYPKCDQIMELRITNFNVEKSQRYIYQQAQKTKMSAANTNSYNTNDLANIITKIINENSLCNIYGMIGRYNSPIDFAIFSDTLRRIFFHSRYRITNDEKRKLRISVSKELIEDFNILTETDDTFLSMKYTKKDIVTILSVFYIYQGKPKDNMVSDIHYVLENKDKIKNQVFQNAGKTAINRIKDLLQKEVQNV